MLFFHGLSKSLYSYREVSKKQKFLVIIRLVDVKIGSKSRKETHRMAMEQVLGDKLEFGFLSSNCCVITAILPAFTMG